MIRTVYESLICASGLTGMPWRAQRDWHLRGGDPPAIVRPKDERADVVDADAQSVALADAACYGRRGTQLVPPSALAVEMQQ